MKLEAEAAPGQRRVVVYSHNESSPDQEVRRAQARTKHPLGPGLNPSSAFDTREARWGTHTVWTSSPPASTEGSGQEKR